MATYNEKKDSVLNQYFRQYSTHIYDGINLFNQLVPQNNSGTLNVMHIMFLCSVIDHFGKVMRVGDVGSDLPLRSGQNASNFKFFIEKYFPASDKCKGDIIYKLFRNGVMHQFFPKASGVFWSNDPLHKDKMLADDRGHPRLNNFTFSNYIKSALDYIIDELENDRLQSYIENIYDYLIISNYGFDDHAELQALFADYAGRGKSFYGPC